MVNVLQSCNSENEGSKVSFSLQNPGSAPELRGLYWKRVSVMMDPPGIH